MPVKWVYLFVNIQKTCMLTPKPACPLIKHTAVSMDSQTSGYAHSNSWRTAYHLYTLTVFCLGSRQPDTKSIFLSYVCTVFTRKQSFSKMKLVEILFYHCCFSYCNHDNGYWLLGTKTQWGRLIINEYINSSWLSGRYFVLFLQ